MQITAAQLRTALPPDSLFAQKQWRISPAPFPLTQKQVQELERLGHQLFLFQKACNDLYALSADGRQPAWIAQLLDIGKPPELVALSRERAFRNALPKVIRPDLLLTESGFILCELDSIPGGIGLTASLNKTYHQLGFPVLGGPDAMLQGFSSIAPNADIIISAEASTYLPEMQWIAERTGQRVVHAETYAQQQDPRPNAYRFFELFDLPNIPNISALQNKSLDPNFQITPPWKPFLEEKLWLALFWMRPLRDYWRRALSERQFLALQKVIPRSWILDPTPLPPHAEIPGLDINDFSQLTSFSQKQRELVIKTSGFSEFAWGARSVVIGSDCSQAEWTDAVHKALSNFHNQPSVLQRFHKSLTLQHSVFEEHTDSIAPFPCKVRLCPYYFCPDNTPILSGALATLCPPDKKILHGMSDAILVPVSTE